MRRRARTAAPAPTGTAYLAALRLLGRRDYTSTEVTTRLLDRGHAPHEVAAAVERLTADRSIDDRRTAEAHVRQAVQLKGRGKIRIKQELQARGIPASIIAAVLSSLSAEDDARAIKRFLERKRMPPRLTAAEHRRIFAQLLRRGFSSDAIVSAMRGRRDPHTE